MLNLYFTNEITLIDLNDVTTCAPQGYGFIYKKKGKRDITYLF